MNLILPNIIMTDKETLTPREVEILYLVSQGKTNKDIADGLHISVATVQKHTKNIYRKLGVHNKIEALQKTKWLIHSVYKNRN
jgi:LuxR family maltose regulon positive regulatory protein